LKTGISRTAVAKLACFVAGQVPFLSLSQQRQSTEERNVKQSSFQIDQSIDQSTSSTKLDK